LPPFSFLARLGLSARSLAYMLDSLVRVTRRVDLGRPFDVSRTPGDPPRPVSPVPPAARQTGGSGPPGFAGSSRRKGASFPPRTGTPPRRGGTGGGARVPSESPPGRPTRPRSHVDRRARRVRPRTPPLPGREGPLGLPFPGGSRARGLNGALAPTGRARFPFNDFKHF